METSVSRPASCRFWSLAFSILRLPSARLDCLALLTAVIALAAQPAARAQHVGTFTSLYTFSDLFEAEGGFPYATLVRGTDGNFYGTTEQGGGYDAGAVYCVTPAGVPTTLYTFTGPDGAHPYTALVQGGDGFFYGTTESGGASSEGYGTVFRITPAGALTTLHSFLGGSDGQFPNAALVQGSDGNFYGTTEYGGTDSDGTLFRISTIGAFTTLYNFTGGSDGANPGSALIQGSDGFFYGTAPNGGTKGNGTVFRISSSGTLTTLYNFGGTSDAGDGAAPQAALVQGSDGFFYGTTSYGGANNCGTVFRITSSGALTILYSFGGSDGFEPLAALVQGSDGNFYGTSYGGGNDYDQGIIGYGLVFRITPGGALTNLYSFTGGNDGSNPASALIQASDGSFYGTALIGGDPTNVNGQVDGTLFNLNPSVPAPSFFTGQTPLGNGVYYLAFPNGNYFGYYSYLSDPNYFYHFDLGYEYMFDAYDGLDGVYFYDFASGDFFYTSPTFPFPYLYDFSLQAVLYYYPDTSSPGHYTASPRYFYDYVLNQIITR